MSRKLKLFLKISLNELYVNSDNINAKTEIKKIEPITPKYQLLLFLLLIF